MDAPTVEQAATMLPLSPLSPLPLWVGHDFGTRYHITNILGAGGMGAVYEAWDKVLEVPVAIKVIRAEPNANPHEARALQQRFKRELLLARQVTHRNVVRIHDLGEVGGITYITMPYVEGSDLRTILKREGRLPVEVVVRTARQVASGLAAAHEAGVIHRDLKPANIMLDLDDEALITDFGSARSKFMSGMGMTVAGAVVGTVPYMAPEQAQGTEVDHRADIYSFGLILRDMLIPRSDAGAGAAIAELMKRMLAPLPPVRSVDPTVPEWLDALITRCLQPEPAARWQSMHDIIVALDQGMERRLSESSLPFVPPSTTPERRKGRILLARQLSLAVILVALLTAGAYVEWNRFAARSHQSTLVASRHSSSLAVLPFHNASGDPTLDTISSSLREMLTTLVGQSPQMRTVTADRLNQVLRDLNIVPNATLTPIERTRVADHTNARHVLSGQITRSGETIRIDATLQDLDRNATGPRYTVEATEALLLTAIGELATRVQTQLSGGSAENLSQLKSTAWRPSTDSFEALRRYTEGVEAMRQGMYQLALRKFQAAIAEDGNFALALSALAQTYATLGSDNEAAQSSRQALALSDNLPPQERYRIAASHYRIVNDLERAIESYENALKSSPGDITVRLALSGLYEQRLALDQARQHLVAIVESEPKFVEALLALGRVEIRRGQPQESLQYLDRARRVALELGYRDNENIPQALGIA